MSETVASPAVRTRIWVLVGTLFVLHFFLHVGVGFGRGAPDLLTIALLLAARDIGLGRAAALGLAFGLLEDSLSVLAFGANAIAMTFVGVGGALTRDVFVGDSRLFLVWYVLVGKWLRDLVHWIAVGSDVRQPFIDQVLIQGGIGSVYPAAVGVAVAALWGLGREA